MKNVGYRIRIDPGQGVVVNIGYLKERTDSVVTGAAFTPDDLSHRPAIFDVLGDGLRIFDQQESLWPDRFQCRRERVRSC